MVRRGLPTDRAQLVEACLETSEDLPRRHRARSGRGELDGQRETIEALAQGPDGRLGVLVGQELGRALPRPLHEQAMGVLGCERAEPPYGFAADPKELAAGGQDADAGAGAQQGARHLGALVDHVLTVVEHHQRITLGQVPAQRIDRLRPARGLKAEHACDLGSDRGRARSGGEVDEPDAVQPFGELTAGYLHRQPGLADPSWAGQRQKPVPAQRLADTLDVPRPADQRGEASRDGRPGDLRAAEVVRWPSRTHRLSLPALPHPPQSFRNSTDDRRVARRTFALFPDVRR